MSNLLCKRTSFCACPEQCRACFVPEQKATVQWSGRPCVEWRAQTMRDREAHFDSSAATAGQKLVLKIQGQPHRVYQQTGRPGRALVQCAAVVVGGDDGLIASRPVRSRAPHLVLGRAGPHRRLECAARRIITHNSMHLSCYVRPTARPDRFSVLYYATAPPA